MPVTVVRSPRVRPPGRDPVRVASLVASVLALALLLAATLSWAVPDLAADWSVRGEARPLLGALVTEGSCATRLVLRTCDVTIHLRTPVGEYTRRQGYAYLARDAEAFDVHALVDPSRPDLATSDLGLDHLSNRVLTLAGATAVLGGLLALAAVATLRDLRAAARPRRPA